MIILKEIAQGNSGILDGEAARGLGWELRKFLEMLQTNVAKRSELKKYLDRQESLRVSVLKSAIEQLVGRLDRAGFEALEQLDDITGWTVRKDGKSYRVRIVCWPYTHLLENSRDEDILFIEGLTPGQLETWLSKRELKGAVFGVLGQTIYEPQTQGSATSERNDEAVLTAIHNELVPLVRNGLLERGYRLLDRTGPTDVLIRTEQALDAIVVLLLENGFEVRVFRDSILGKHDSGRFVFVKLSTLEDELTAMPDVRGVIVTYQDFRRILLAIVNAWNITHEIDKTQFNQDVLTSLGWHSYSGSWQRQPALEMAVAIFGLDHVVRLLTWLSNAWRNHPTNYVYVEAVQEDLDWLYTAYASSGQQYIIRNEALKVLREHCQNLIQANLEFRKMVSSAWSVNRFFLIRQP